MGVAATWLPPDLSIVQPYSMGPVVGCPDVLDRPCPLGARMLVSPASGTMVRMDDEITVGGRFFPPNVMMIKGAFVAPARVQRAAQKAGETALIMEYPKGLREALGLIEQGQPSDLVNIGGGHGGLEVPASLAQTFTDALRALEDED